MSDASQQAHDFPGRSLDLKRAGIKAVARNKCSARLTHLSQRRGEPSHRKNHLDPLSFEPRETSIEQRCRHERTQSGSPMWNGGSLECREETRTVTEVSL
jgi:hypothetical protein